MHHVRHQQQTNPSAEHFSTVTSVAPGHYGHLTGTRPPPGKKLHFLLSCSELQWTADISGLLVSIIPLPPHTGSRAKVADGIGRVTSDMFVRLWNF